MPEIQRVIDRCRTCGQAETFAVSGEDLDESGDPRTWVRTERLPHTAQDCQRFLLLERETWPKLF